MRFHQFQCNADLKAIDSIQQNSCDLGLKVCFFEFLQFQCHRLHMTCFLAFELWIKPLTKSLLRAAKCRARKEAEAGADPEYCAFHVATFDNLF